MFDWAPLRSLLWCLNQTDLRFHSTWKVYLICSGPNPICLASTLPFLQVIHSLDRYSGAGKSRKPENDGDLLSAKFALFLSYAALRSNPFFFVCSLNTSAFFLILSSSCDKSDSTSLQSFRSNHKSATSSLQKSAVLSAVGSD